MSLMISTTGITRIARPIPTRYSLRAMVLNPKRAARKGTSITRVVSTNARAIAPKRSIFFALRAKIEPLCERILSEWKISDIDIVRNAIVIPCAE